MSRKSASTAQRRIDQYNREVAAIAALEDRLYRLRQKNRKTHSACFDALPEGYAISLPGSNDSDRSIELVAPKEIS